MKKPPSAQKRPEGEMVRRSGVTSTGRKSKLLRLAQVDRVFGYAPAILAHKLRISDQSLVLLEVFLNIAHILQKAEMLLMLGMGHFNPGNFDDVGHRETFFIK
jgi:hypothetical protein